MAGNVDDADFLAGGEGEPGETEVDGHAPFALLGEPVGVDAGQGFDEGGLAVVHVACCANDVHYCLSNLGVIQGYQHGWVGAILGVGGLRGERIRERCHLMEGLILEAPARFRIHSHTLLHLRKPPLILYIWYHARRILTRPNVRIFEGT